MNYGSDIKPIRIEDRTAVAVFDVTRGDDTVEDRYFVTSAATVIRYSGGNFIREWSFIDGLAAMAFAIEQTGWGSIEGCLNKVTSDLWNNEGGEYLA